MNTLIEFDVKEQRNLNEVAKNTLKKVGSMVDNIPVPVTRIEGKVSETEVAITIMTDDKHVTLAGKYDENTKKFPVQVWNDNIPAGTLEWFPILTYRDLIEFENDFTEIINS